MTWLRRGPSRTALGTPRQMELIGSRPVMIHPGHSGLTARQVLDRFLGR